MISAILVELWMRYFLILGRAMVSHNVIFCGLYLRYVESSRCQRYFSSPHFSAETSLDKPIHFRQFTALLKYTSISTKFGLRILGYIVEKKKRHSVLYNQHLEFWNWWFQTQWLTVYLHYYASRCARDWLWRQGSSLRGSSLWIGS